MTYRGRFAPSPTGDLHFGSLVAAAGSWLRARSRSGTWIVRMEDLDPPREIAGSAQRILDALARFGMPSDEPVEYQSRRGERYAAALGRLVDAGAVFECRCSRADLGDGAIHRGRCTASPANAGRSPAWRLRAPNAEVAFDDAIQGTHRQDLKRDVGDFIVRRIDGLWAYQLAVVVDDADQAIGEVVRGCDLLDSTPRQIHLQRTLGLPTPAYAHLPLAVDAAGVKLSKQLASAPVDPADPLPALRRALEFLGQSLPALPAAAGADLLLRRAAEAFDIDRVPRQTRIGVEPVPAGLTPAAPA
jgi:glutamyl-Q tRNA(Asp) synthetase